MFTSILVPVDLAHPETTAKALETAGWLAAASEAHVTYVGVTASAPDAVARNPEAFAEKLDALAAAEAEAHGIRTAAKSYVSPDPAIDLDATLMRAVREVGADLVVMASHVPGMRDRLWASHGGQLAAHAEISVFLVR